MRVGRVWRRGDVHVFSEFTVNTMLESDMAHAFLTPSNEGMTATDTQKNAVYVVAQRLATPVGPEELAVALAAHFLTEYPLVSVAKVDVEQAPWRRAVVGGQASRHRAATVPPAGRAAVPGAPVGAPRLAAHACSATPSLLPPGGGSPF